MTDRLVLVEVCLLEVAELGLQVLEVFCDALVLLRQPHISLRILLLMLPILGLQYKQSHMSPQLIQLTLQRWHAT